MAYRLNVDMWHVVNPEDQKVHRLSRGDKVPSWALPEGDELDALVDTRVPVFVKDESDAGPRNTAASAASDKGQAAEAKK
jgi:hypothetical protein